MRDIVVFREPKLKPLPASLAPAMRDAQLPLRLERARQAVAECCDLSELLTWKDKAAAIAAAAKASRMPDIARDANRICKEALLRLGQLLDQYSDVLGTLHDGRIKGRTKSERTKASIAAGIPKHVANAAHRLALAPRETQQRILNEDRIPASSQAIARLTPARMAPRRQSLARSVLYRSIMSGTDEFGRTTAHGLNFMLSAGKMVARHNAAQLAPDEKRAVRAKIAEIMEVLDAIDEAAK